VNLAWDWKHGPSRILVVLVGLPPEPGFAQERASGHQALGCTGADLLAKVKELGDASKSDLVPVGGSDEEESGAAAINPAAQNHPAWFGLPGPAAG
jgi:hypothetical protein